MYNEIDFTIEDEVRYKWVTGSEREGLVIVYRLDAWYIYHRASGRRLNEYPLATMGEAQGSLETLLETGINWHAPYADVLLQLLKKDWVTP